MSTPLAPRPEKPHIPKDWSALAQALLWQSYYVEVADYYEQRLRVAVEALQKYGRHGFPDGYPCASGLGVNSITGRVDCNCGLEEALALIGPLPEEEK